MKKFYYLLVAALVATFSLTLVSCNDDDDENEGGNGGSSKVTLNVGGQNVTFNNVYWNIDPEASTSTQHYYQLEFCSFNLYGGKIPSMFSMFYLGFLASGDEGTLPTGTFDEFSLSGSVNASATNGEGTYIEGNQKNSGKLVISKDGDKYTVSIEPLYLLYGEEDDGNNASSVSTSLHYTGSLPKAPRKSWED